LSFFSFSFLLDTFIPRDESKLGHNEKHNFSSLSIRQRLRQTSFAINRWKEKQTGRMHLNTFSPLSKLGSVLFPWISMSF
jgi:hypothetical protein